VLSIVSDISPPLPMYIVNVKYLLALQYLVMLIKGRLHVKYKFFLKVAYLCCDNGTQNYFFENFTFYLLGKNRT
jgi:hypothetical protein